MFICYENNKYRTACQVVLVGHFIYHAKWTKIWAKDWAMETHISLYLPLEVKLVTSL